MKRLVLCVTFATLFLRSHPAANPPPLIEWQPATAPFGGDAEATVTHGRLLLVRTPGYGHPVWWMSPDQGASWQQTLPRLTDGWSITSLGDELFVIDSGRIQRTADRRPVLDGLQHTAPHAAWRRQTLRVGAVAPLLDTRRWVVPLA